MKLKAVLTIAGSDPSGGAGIQADLKTMITNGVYGMSAMTALTAQNTTGVTGIMEVPADFLRKQIESVFDDIRPDAVKIGMVPSAELAETIADVLGRYGADNVVLDPVMVATSGSKLMRDETVRVLRERLIPAADIITPNIPEAETLTGMDIGDRDDMEKAAVLLAEEYGCAVLCKGGHSVADADDVLCTADGGKAIWFHGERIENPNTHGTGCTLSSAIASNLAKGMNMEKAVGEAKAYISGALAAMLDMGSGSGPLDHAFDMSGRFMTRW